MRPPPTNAESAIKKRDETRACFIGMSYAALKAHLVFSAHKQKFACTLTGPPPYAGPGRHRARPLSEMSEGKRGRNEQPGADQQGERDTADGRQNSAAATCGLGVGGGSLRRQERHPEVTHGISLRSRCGDLSVFRSPFRTGAAHIVRFGPIVPRLIRGAAPPGVRHSRTRLRNCAGKDV